MAFARKRKAKAADSGDSSADAASTQGKEPPIAARVHNLDAVWHREQYKRTALTALVAVLLLTGSLSANVIQALTEPNPRYFAVDNSLRVVDLKPKTEPTVTQEKLLNWATKTVTETFALDFKHWKTEIMEVRPAYFPNAYDSLIETMRNPDGVIDFITSERAISSAAVPQAPVVTNEGLSDGRYSWVVEFPLVVTFETGDGVAGTKRLNIRLFISRVAGDKYPAGIRIQQFVARPG